LPLSACFLNMCFVLTCAFLSQDKIALVWLKEKQCTQSSHSGRHNVYTASRRSSLHTAAADLQLLESGKAEVQESAGQWQRAWSERLTICREDLLWKEAFRVLQLVNTPDIYGENKYQRRNLLLYHWLLESGLRKFNVFEQCRVFGIAQSQEKIRSAFIEDVKVRV
jgi:hypothetical protein